MDDNKKKRGYRLMIQAGLSDEQFKDAWRWALNWKEVMEETNYSWKHKTKGGHWSAYRRHAFGHLIKSEPEFLVFRRISTSRRVFAIVKISEIAQVGMEPHHEVKCCCPECTTFGKWGWANGEPKMYKAFEFGETKGR